MTSIGAMPRVVGGVADDAGTGLVRRLRLAVSRSVGALALGFCPASDTEVRIARVFDGCDDGTPWFGASHPCVVDAAHRERLLDLLRGGEVVFRSDVRLPDLLSGATDAVCADLRSDGTWVWSEASAYYLERHRLRPDRELVAHLMTAPVTAALARGDRSRVRAALTRNVLEVSS